MKRVPLKRLESQIVKPGFEEKLKPLTRFRGGYPLGRVHRLWNLMVAAKEHEASYLELYKTLPLNRAYSQLCAPERPTSLMTLRSFVGRMKGRPEIFREAPHLQEYIDDLLPLGKGPFHLIPMLEPPEDFAQAAKGKSIIWAKTEYGVDDRIARRWFEETGIDRVHGGLLPLPKQWKAFAVKENNFELARRFGVCAHTIARWRSDTGDVCLAPRRHAVASGTIVYPFVIHDGGKPEHALLRKVNAAVPKHLDPETRADICQDLVVGILCGDFSEDDLLLPTKEMTKRVMQMFPAKYGPVSLDQIVPGTENLRLIDRITEEDSLWERT